MKQQTLAIHLDKFAPKERMIMCWLLQNSGHMKFDIHPGVLPFLKACDVLNALAHTDGRVVAAIKAKLKALYDIDDSMSFSMYLNNKKVVSRLGKYPER